MRIFLSVFPCESRSFVVGKLKNYPAQCISRATETCQMQTVFFHFRSFLDMAAEANNFNAAGPTGGELHVAH